MEITREETIRLIDNLKSDIKAKNNEIALLHKNFEKRIKAIEKGIKASQKENPKLYDGYRAGIELQS